MCVGNVRKSHVLVVGHVGNLSFGLVVTSLDVLFGKYLASAHYGAQ